METEQYSGKKASILLVDDRPENLMVLEATIGSLGYNLVKANSGEEALKCVLERDFAAILLDAQMPVMDGFETALLIQARARSQHIPIIFLTAVYHNPDHVAKGYAAGAMDYLVKPVLPAVLQAKVSALVRVWEQTQAATRRGYQSEAVTTAILQSSLDAFITMNHLGMVVEWNPAAERMFGYPRDEAVGRELCELIISESLRDRHRAGLARYLVTGEGPVIGEQVEMPAVRRDGTEFPAELAITRIPTDGPPMFSGNVRDITTRKEAEKALRESNRRLREADRRKDEFLAMLGHELRNPLGVISNATQVLKHAGGEDQNLIRPRSIIDRQVRHLARIVDDLLDVSRLTRGLIELRPQSVDLGRVVAAAVESCDGAIAAKGQSLSLTLPEQSVPLEADPTRLTQILCNLLDNAAKYTDPGGQIALVAGVEEVEGKPWVVLSIKDTGTGIAPELLPNVFDLFTQGERSLDRAEGGMGLGLTLVQRLVEMHGGTVMARSEGVGKGAEFIVRLPAKHSTPDESEPLPPAESLDLTQQTRVLLVEDNLDAADTLTDLLQDWGHGVLAIHNGEAALEAARIYRPEVALLDIGLPGMDGYEIAKELRNQPEFADMLIIAITGYGQEGDRRRSQEARIDHHLVKPLDPEQLHLLLATVGRP